MDNNKLIQILETFSKKEWREFSKFVESPYFNTDKHCIRLLDILKREFVKKDGFQLSRTRLEKLFSKNNAADASLLNVKLSLLTRLAEQFFAQQELEEKPLLSKHLLLKRLFKRGLNNHFESAYRRNIHLQESPEKVSPEYYQYKYLLEEDFLNHVITSDKKTFIARENLQKTNEVLDIYYILNKINLHDTMKLSERVYQKVYDWDSFKSIEALALLPRYANHPVVQIYYTAHLLTCNFNHKDFKYLMELLSKNGNMLTSFELQNIYILAANYCVSQIRKGKNYYNEIHNVYREMEEADLLVFREWADVKTVQNVILSGLKINKFKWADYIIEKYINKIEPNIRSDSHNYFSALCAFHKKKFSKAIEYLSVSYSIDYEFNMNIKLFLLKSYYEQDTEYSYHTEQVIRSFKVFFKQSKYFSVGMKKSYINFANIMYCLYRVKHNEGRITIEDALQKIEEYELLMDKKWLLEKIEELQNRPIRRALC